MGSWLQWVRTRPALAVAVLVFCLTAVVGLVLSLPPGMMSAGRSSRVAERASAEPAAAPAGTAPRGPGAPADEAPESEPVATGPWVVESASPPSPRGLALIYAHRTLPPGGESRFEWVVRLQGARSVLEGVDMVGWRMDPPAKNGGEFVSRNRAGDGFPLLGHGPGGWFGVAATVRYKDGNEESLSHRIELPD